MSEEKLKNFIQSSLKNEETAWDQSKEKMLTLLTVNLKREDFKKNIKKEGKEDIRKNIKESNSYLSMYIISFLFFIFGLFLLYAWYKR